MTALHMPAPVVSAAARALALGDARQDAGRARGLLYELVGGAPIRWRERLVRRGARRFGLHTLRELASVLLGVVSRATRR